MRHAITGISCVAARKNQEFVCLEELMHRALEDSKVKIADHNRDNIGIFLGTTFSNFYIRKNNFDKLNKLTKSDVRRINPADFPKLLISYLGGCVSIKFGTKGALSVLSSGQASGLDALHQALFFLQRNKKNIAFVIDLDENWHKNKASSAKSGVCFVCESISSQSPIKVYADILRVENFFEKKNKNSGLCKCLKKTLEFCSSQKAMPQYFYSSQIRGSKKYALEQKALSCIFADKKFKLMPAKTVTNSSLRAVYDNIKQQRLCPWPENLAVSLFLNIGENANSSCVTIGSSQGAKMTTNR
ncbi:MAG: beta-ketoacyl synthase N-terminal-like domain-containing protein [Candidatus Omnitrophica bacterium]|nr:beta-ketoacyl synthase N-terminal-like domain-containing protein [Candidatus Omnitrophota bacterium]